MSNWLSRPLVVLLMLVGGVGLTPLSAGADPGVTITVAPQAALLDPTLVRVSVEITCAPMQVAFNMGNAQLEQAVSKTQIAHGSGFEQSQIVCDGAFHPNSYLMWADSGGPPFKQGDATVNISAYLCDSTFICQSGSSGIQVIRLKK